MGEGVRGSDLLKLSGLLALSATGCLLLYALRVAIAGNTFYSYLVWNLLLAMVPYVLAALGTEVVSRLAAPRRRKAALAVFATLWLLFYPNAPYIFTDFIHVVNKDYLRGASVDRIGLGALLWYDLLMTAAFAFIGHFIGLVSMWLMHHDLAGLWGTWPARAVTVAAMLLSGFGIYLGRFSRLNSWDLVFDFRRTAGVVVGASADPRAILFSAAFALFILLSYAALAVFKRISPPRPR